MAPSWIPPPVGLVKINIDVVVGNITRVASLAALVIDEQGLYLAASLVTLQGKSDLEMLEVLACREALAPMTDMGACVVRVASDCKAGVRMIQEETIGICGQVVKEIKDLRSNFVELG
jgi:hypothetical protein